MGTHNQSVLSVNAFLEKAVGVKRVLLHFFWTRFFSHRVAADAILPSALSRSDVISLGASWAFSLQPVLNFAAPYRLANPPAVSAPSQVKTCPVMYAASSEAR
jgi:hypothetical protein